MARLQQVYKEKVVPKLFKEFAYKNVMQVPRVRKITLNMGVGEAVADKKQIENAVRDMTAIAGQKPVVTKARKSIAGFKIRDGWPIGCKVTLRGEHMWEFLDAEAERRHQTELMQYELQQLVRFPPTELLQTEWN